MADSMTEEKALALLGQNVPAETVAASLGITPSAISQMLANEDFAARVNEQRFLNLAAHSERDNHYDELEDKLLDKLENSIPMMHKAGEILKALQVVNSAKRRGSAAPAHLNENTTVIPLTLPTQIIQQFTVNAANNQVVKVGEQTLITMQSGTLADKLKVRREENGHDSATAPGEQAKLGSSQG